VAAAILEAREAASKVSIRAEAKQCASFAVTLVTAR
jgi:hypothetical protein